MTRTRERARLFGRENREAGESPALSRNCDGPRSAGPKPGDLPDRERPQEAAFEEKRPESRASQIQRRRRTRPPFQKAPDHGGLSRVRTGESRAAPHLGGPPWRSGETAEDSREVAKGTRMGMARTAWRTAGPVALTLAAATLALTALAGCGGARGVGASDGAGTPQGSPGFPVVLADDAGRTVTLGAPARRVVSLAPANTEIMYSLGALDRVVGVTTFDDYPAAVAGIAKMGDFTTPNLEAIAAARPDLVLVTGGVQADVLGKLEGLGAEVLVIDPTDIDGVYRGIRTVAAALGTGAEGEREIARMKVQLADIEKRVRGRDTATCFVEIGWNPLYTTGPGTLIDDLVQHAGGTNVVAQSGYVGYSVEQLLKDRPMVYLGTRSSLGDGAGLGARPGYAGLEAVKAGRVVVLDDNLVSRPGPRVVDGVREIALALHPDAFPATP
jgi:iron complex transport system substrate-binding protein